MQQKINREDPRRKIMAKVAEICSIGATYADEEISELLEMGEPLPPDLPVAELTKSAVQLLELTGVQAQGDSKLDIIDIPCCEKGSVIVRFGFVNNEKNDRNNERIFDLVVGKANDRKSFMLDIQCIQRECDFSYLFSYRCPLTDFLSDDEINALLRT